MRVVASSCADTRERCTRKLDLGRGDPYLRRWDWHRALGPPPLAGRNAPLSSRRHRMTVMPLACISDNGAVSGTRACGIVFCVALGQLVCQAHNTRATWQVAGLHEQYAYNRLYSGCDASRAVVAASLSPVKRCVKARRRGRDRGELDVTGVDS